MNYLGHLRYWNAAYFCSCIMKCAKKRILYQKWLTVYISMHCGTGAMPPHHTPLNLQKMYFKVKENCMCKKCIASFKASFCWPLLIAMHWMQLLLRRFHKLSSDSHEKERGYSNPPQPPLVDVVYNVHCFFLFVSFFLSCHTPPLPVTLNIFCFNYCKQPKLSRWFHI